MTDESCHVVNTTHSNNDESDNISMHDLSIKEKICSIKLLSTYIDCLIDNIPKENIPRNMDMCFDSGAFNGLYGHGAALFISRLEAAGYTKIHRVSGASIGSVLALMYLININYNLDNAFIAMQESIKTHHCLKSYREQVSIFVNTYLTADLLSKIQGRLYITYYDINARKQIVVSQYDSNDHVIECIMRSSHLPYLSTGELYYKKKYMDGVYPYIFTDSVRPTFFIQLVTAYTIKNFLYVNKERNSQTRIFYGVNEANNFFMKKNSSMCSYTSDWGKLKKAEFRVREAMTYILLIIIHSLVVIASYMPKIDVTSVAYRFVLKFTNEIYGDILSNMVNM